MALLCFNSFTLTSLHSPNNFSSTTLAAATSPVSLVSVKPAVLPTKCLIGVQISTPYSTAKKRAGAVVVGASADGGASPAAEDGGVGSQSPQEGKGENVTVDKLPLESKLKEREEQRLRMKLAKKIRLRRKRLVRKRRLRKKGRWPPSKMKKLKNV